MQHSHFRVLQLTDCHLFGSPQKMFGADCNQNFLEVIEKIKKNDEAFDFILATGDLAQDESDAAYMLFKNTLEAFKKPVYWIAGNHDNPERMKKIFETSPYFFHVDQLKQGDFEFIFIDTRDEGKDTGWVSENALQKLEPHLKSCSSKAIAIVTHHHLIPVGSPLVDHYIVKNPKDFLSMVEKDPRVRLLICGHVHHDYEIHHAGLTLETGPATCLQWAKKANKPEADRRIGYKIYTFEGTNYSAKSVMWEPDRTDAQISHRSSISKGVY